LKEGFVVGMQACPGNPYDGHTLVDQLDQVARLTGKMPKRAHVDKGYKAHGIEPEICQVLISGSRHGINKPLAREMSRKGFLQTKGNNIVTVQPCPNDDLGRLLSSAGRRKAGLMNPGRRWSLRGAGGVQNIHSTSMNGSVVLIAMAGQPG
jgi:hypothetical protein